ncbi:hypothetical protein [Rhodanobacter sp. L36]|uniref:hypothetical protein n=1 Tax=Rhodanobacter sp. L36 TaxID=1747221 RepID=UPI00131BC5F9|nr:hypothetical protein [Rhodanobacter sp. L36]
MFSTSTHPRSHCLRNAFVFCSLAAGALFCTAHAKDAASKTFDGSWEYRSDCQFGHYVQLDLKQKDAVVTGDWSDGTRVEGWDGSLEGRISGSRLYARYCSTEANGGHAVCPSYDPDGSDYFARQNRDLIWFRSIGKGAEKSFEKYVVLHPFIKGKRRPADTKCPSDN